MKKPSWICILLMSLLNACSTENTHNEQSPNQPGPVSFATNDLELQQSWDWARKTAYSYVRDSEKLGLWYEAALPGREAFCMRDVSHQAAGAIVLGLEEHTLNMLRRFAENVSESKDWCSYWEINKNNLPAPVDYKNDKDFWYNLPANFDIFDACMRMFMRTGDSTYLIDTVFMNFYARTMSDYILRWNLSPDQILTRKRIINLPADATPGNHYFYDKRGIPGYHEGGRGKMQVGIDMLAVQYAAYNWAHFLRQMKINPCWDSTDWLTEAKKLDSLISNIFWDPERQDFRIILYSDGTMDHTVGNGQDFSHSLLHYNTLEDTTKINSILEHYSKKKESVIIEIASHLPEIFFRYGHPAEGILMLKHLSKPSTPRRSYPENPFALIGAFEKGLMGLDIQVSEKYVSSYSGFTDSLTWGTMEHIPFGLGWISLLHQGKHTSVFRNHTSDTLYWQSFLQAGPDQWYINQVEEVYDGEIMNWYGQQILSWFIAVPPGETISISARQATRSLNE